MTLTIRRAAASDIPSMQFIERDAAQAFRTVGYDFCADGPVRTVQEHQCGINDGACLIAEVDGVAVGFILLWCIDGHAHITEVSVAQAFQRSGIGRALIQAGEEWAKRSGFCEITLTTFRDVSWNAPFYCSLGYAEFEPDAAQTGLAAVQQEETEAGFSSKPRIAMRKAL